MPKALIVDDVEENLYLLRSLLQGSGYEVRAAGDGRAALALAAQETPDLVISDILMPGMDGFTLCREWRRDPRFKEIPFVFYTATYTDPRDEELALSVGADLFLVKPLEPAEFLDQIAEVLRRCAAGQIRTSREPDRDERGFLKEYSQTLVRKLESKVNELTEANRALLIKDAAIESATSGIAFADLSGCVTYANPAMALLVGCEAAALPGKTLTEILGQAAVEEIERGLSAGADWHGDVDPCLAPGRGVVLEAVVHTVHDPSGRALCRMLSFQDVTERRMMAEEVQQSQRLASLSVFAGGIAHDFNNLLTGLFGNIELARTALPADSEARGYLETATLAYERARDLTSRLLSFAKSRPLSRGRQVVVPLVRDCCALSLSGSSATWTIAGSESDAVLGDANQLSQVFTNILINARQAMPNGGNVRIAVTPREVVNDGRGLADGRYVEVVFEDDGPGIPENIVSRVFDPFFTTKPGGTGLGLAVCHSIVESHGGAIRVFSLPGQGATFELLLPAASAAGESAVQRPAAGTADPEVADRRRGGRVLVMDDEAPIREMAARMLRQDGFEVEVAGDGEQTLEACHAAAVAGRPFDLVLLDITVRGGMGGLETLAEIRRQHPHTAVVLSSGYAEKGWSHEDVHPDAVLPKPYQMHDLQECVRRVTRAARARRQV